MFMASAAALAGCASTGAAGPFDLVVKGGRVVDPASGLDGVRDIGVRGGRIAAVARRLEPGGAQVVDAAGKVVTPGFVDIHTHLSSNPQGPALALADGVTSWIDAGTRGADNVGQAVAAARASVTPGRILINIGRQGVRQAGDTMDLWLADVGAARAALEANREFVVGVKARLSSEIAGPNDYEAVKRAQEATTPLGLPVMIHIGHSVTPLGRLVDLMKPGDVVTHLFTAPPHGLLGDDGRIIPEVLAARRRGVRFDVGNGRGTHVRWDVAERILDQGFMPDTISSDWTTQGQQAGLTNLPLIMSSMMMLGFTLDQAVACVTSHAAAAFPAFREKGTLKADAVADIVVMEMREGEFEFRDSAQTVRKGRVMLKAVASVLGGRLAERPAAP
jgi:dihydroorotase